MTNLLSVHYAHGRQDALAAWDGDDEAVGRQSPDGHGTAEGRTVGCACQACKDYWEGWHGGILDRAGAWFRAHKRKEAPQ